MDVEEILAKMDSKPSVLKGLSGISFFPETLPPPFEASDFGAIVDLQKSGNPFGSKDACSSRPTLLSKFSQARPGNRRRYFGIVHPVTFARLCHEIAADWGRLHKKASSEPAGSSPLVKPSPESITALQPPFNSREKRDRRAQIRSNAKYLVKADIARFYPSIYTHAIAWAIDGKNTIKQQRRNPEYLGNRIDKAVRNCQDQQTMGLPIGQDAFRILAEILLTRVDEKVGAEVNFYYRYSDDIEASFATMSEAEDFLSLLTYSLHSYNLHLNESKTQVVRLPLPLEEDWVTDLRSRSVASDREIDRFRQRAQLISLFDAAFRLQRDWPASAALNYAISLLPDDEHFLPRIHSENLEQLVSLLTHCATVEPSTLPRVISYLASISRRRPLGGDERVVKLARTMIHQGAELGHSTEICWGLWLALMLDIEIADSSDLAQKIMTSGDQASKVLYLRAVVAGGAQETEVIVDWVSEIASKVPDALRGEDWLLLYECAAQELTAAASAWLESDDHFSYLLNNNVRFVLEGSDKIQMTCEHRRRGSQAVYG